MNYLPRYFTSKAIIAYIAVLITCLVFFTGRSLPVVWIIFGLTEVLGFFYFSNLLTRRWANISEKHFIKKIFTAALTIRIIYVVGILLFYQGLTGTPFEFSAADSQAYHAEGLRIAGLISDGNFGNYFNSYTTGYSDSGFPIFLSVVYLLTGKGILLARLLNALIGAWMCVLLYKLARRTFDERAARITAVLAVILPTLIYYCGLHLKETLMIFILLAFAERADYMIRSHTLKPGLLVTVVLLGASLFFFRTVLAAAAWFSLITAFIFSSNRLIGTGRKVVLIMWFSIAALVVMSGKILTEVETYAKDRTTNQKDQMSNFANREGGNKLAKLGSTLVFLPMMLVGPFPTMVNIAGQENAMMINGSVFAHNVYAFFVIVAFLVLIRKRLIRNNVLILTLVISYWVILANSGFAISERFHLPTVPFLLILAGYGITQVKGRYVKYYIPYLAFMFLVVIGWNWFKLAGRGMI